MANSRWYWISQIHPTAEQSLSDRSKTSDRAVPFPKSLVACRRVSSLAVPLGFAICTGGRALVIKVFEPLETHRVPGFEVLEESRDPIDRHWADRMLHQAGIIFGIRLGDAEDFSEQRLQSLVAAIDTLRQSIAARRQLSTPVVLPLDQPQFLKFVQGCRDRTWCQPELICQIPYSSNRMGTTEAEKRLQIHLMSRGDGICAVHVSASRRGHDRIAQMFEMSNLVLLDKNTSALALPRRVGSNAVHLGFSLRARHWMGTEGLPEIVELYRAALFQVFEKSRHPVKRRQAHGLLHLNGITFGIHLIEAEHHD